MKVHDLSSMGYHEPNPGCDLAIDWHNREMAIENGYIQVYQIYIANCIQSSLCKHMQERDSAIVQPGYNQQSTSYINYSSHNHCLQCCCQRSERLPVGDALRHTLGNQKLVGDGEHNIGIAEILVKLSSSKTLGLESIGCAKSRDI